MCTLFSRFLLRALWLASLIWFYAVTCIADVQKVFLVDDPMGAPFRVRDYTFPSFLMLGFAPAPAAPLGRRHFAIELHYSLINNFQVSPEVENYLTRSRGNARYSLNSEDVAYILGLPQEQAYYIDGEFSMLELAFHWGLTDRLDLGVSANYMHFGGNLFDEGIYNFHEAVGLGQGGREYVVNDQVQVVLGRDSAQNIVILERPSSGGLGDPSIFLRYALPGFAHKWRGNIGIGIKVPLMNKNKFLSTGSWDLGYQFTLDKSFDRDAGILNLGTVFPGRFRQSDFRTQNLHFINFSWMHRFKRWTNTRSFVQVHVAKHPYRVLVDSGLSETVYQVTIGFKWDTSAGIFGVGLTENFFNFDNTPDLGLHLTWGILK